MILLLEDYKIISNVLVHEKGSRIIIYNKQDVEQLKQAFRVTPYLDLLSEQIDAHRRRPGAGHGVPGPRLRQGLCAGLRRPGGRAL